MKGKFTQWIEESLFYFLEDLYFANNKASYAKIQQIFALNYFDVLKSLKILRNL